jgi:hypothetical protein
VAVGTKRTGVGVGGTGVDAWAAWAGSATGVLVGVGVDSGAAAPQAVSRRVKHTNRPQRMNEVKRITGENLDESGQVDADVLAR